MSNPHFKNSNRAAYELPFLLVNLGPVSSSATQDQAQMAKAVASHACNANDVIMRGIETIGQMLFHYAADRDVELDRYHLGSLGELLQHLAVEAQYLQGADVDMEAIVTSYEQSNTKSKPAGQRAGASQTKGQ